MTNPLQQGASLMGARRVIKGIGVAVVDYRFSGFEANLMLLERLGCDSAELEIAECGVIANGRLHGSQLRRIAKILGRRKLMYTVHAPLIMNFMDEQHLDQHKQVCRACLAFCDAIGAKILVVQDRRQILNSYLDSVGIGDRGHLQERL